MVLIRGYFSPQMELKNRPYQLTKSWYQPNLGLSCIVPWYGARSCRQILSIGPQLPVMAPKLPVRTTTYHFSLGCKFQSTQEFRPLLCTDRLFPDPTQKHCTRCLLGSSG